MSSDTNPRFPREDLVRAVRVGVQMRAHTDENTDPGTDGMPTLFGHFTPFNRWTEIQSMWEGNFMERVSPGAFKKTFREQTPKVLFQHGSDPQIGDKPLGAASVLREEEQGPYYEVELLDTAYVREIVPGLEAGLYGASFRFSVMREEWVDEPTPSDENPKGIPERTLKELRVAEFGPVTFPAYADASAGVRSITDAFILQRLGENPERLRSMFEQAYPLEPKDAPSTPDAAPTRGTSGRERREPARKGTFTLNHQKEGPSWRLP